MAAVPCKVHHLFTYPVLPRFPACMGKLLFVVFAWLSLQERNPSTCLSTPLTSNDRHSQHPILDFWPIYFPSSHTPPPHTHRDSLFIIPVPKCLPHGPSRPSPADTDARADRDSRWAPPWHPTCSLACIHMRARQGPQSLRPSAAEPPLPTCERGWTAARR
eukprot:359793-Chlamydomonas_euryale.AAC.10